MCASLCVSVCVCVPVCFCSMHQIGISLCAKGVRPIEGNCEGVCVCVPYMCLFARVSVCAYRICVCLHACLCVRVSLVPHKVHICVPKERHGGTCCVQ